MSRVPTCEGKTSKTSRNSLAFASLKMEVGIHHYRLRCRFAPYSNRPQCHLGDYGSTHQIVHFLAICSTFSLERLVKLYINEIVKLHGVSISIVSDIDDLRRAIME